MGSVYGESPHAPTHALHILHSADVPYRVQVPRFSIAKGGRLVLP